MGVMGLRDRWAPRVLCISLAGFLVFSVGVGAVASPGQSAPASPKSKAPDWSRIERELKTALQARNFPRIFQLVVNDVAPHPGPRAANLLIRYALTGDDFKLELKAGSILRSMQDTASRKIIYDNAVKNANYKTRIVLLAVAYYHSKKSDAKALDALLKALTDPRREVVFQSLRLIRSLRKDKIADALTRKAVDALIFSLERRERQPHGRVYYDIRSALREITGEDLQIAADWKNWWRVRRGTFRPPDKPKQPGAAKTGVVQSFFTIPLNSDRVLFMIDVSGSMEKRDPPLVDTRRQGTGVVKKDEQKIPPITRERLYRVKQELIRTIERIPEHISFGIQSFSHEIHFLMDQPQLIQATPSNRQKAVQWVKTMEPLGETWTDVAFQRVLKEVEGVDTVICLSDGMPQRQKQKFPKKVLEQVRIMNRFAKVRVHTIGFEQLGANLQWFLSTLANDNDGMSVFLK